MGAEWQDFVRLLHRGGQVWHLCDDDRSYWLPCGVFPTVLPRGNVWFSVNPCRAIPTHNDEGKPAKRAYVRSQIAYLAGIGCLFAEFDGDKAANWRKLTDFEPAPTAVVDSGGGYHAYWLLHEPFSFASDADRERARRVQWAWVEHVGGDTAAKNVNRVLRWPGSRNMKPKYAPDFPTVTVVWYCPWAVYDLATLEALLPPKRVEPTPQIATWRLRPPNPTYGNAALRAEAERVAGASEGTRNDALNRAAWAIGRLVASGALSESDAEATLVAAAQTAGLPEREARATVRSGITAGKAKPRFVKKLTRMERKQRAARARLEKLWQTR